jgi:hypothetical protein
VRDGAIGALGRAKEPGQRAAIRHDLAHSMDGDLSVAGRSASADDCARVLSVRCRR